MGFARDCADYVLGFYAFGLADIDKESYHSGFGAGIVEVGLNLASSAAVKPAVASLASVESVASLPSVIASVSLESAVSLIPVKAVSAVPVPFAETAIVSLRFGDAVFRCRCRRRTSAPYLVFELQFDETGGNIRHGEVLIHELFDRRYVGGEIALAHYAAQFIEEFVNAAVLDFFYARRLHASDLCLRKLLDHAEFCRLTRTDKGVCTSRLARTSRTSDSVDVILGILRNVVVVDRVDIVDVNAPCRNIGGDKHIERAGPEFVHYAVAGGLVHVAVESFGEISAGVKQGRYFVDTLLRVAEDHRETAVYVDKAAEDVEFVLFACLDIELFNRRNGEHGRSESQKLGIGLELLRYLENWFGHRRRKQNCLANFGGILQNLLEILLESHIEHLVGFVEDDCLYLVKCECPPS